MTLEVGLILSQQLLVRFLSETITNLHANSKLERAFQEVIYIKFGVHFILGLRNQNRVILPLRWGLVPRPPWIPNSADAQVPSLKRRSTVGPQYLWALHSRLIEFKDAESATTEG